MESCFSDKAKSKQRQMILFKTCNKISHLFDNCLESPSKLQKLGSRSVCLFLFQGQMKTNPCIRTLPLFRLGGGGCRTDSIHQELSSITSNTHQIWPPLPKFIGEQNSGKSLRQPLVAMATPFSPPRLVKVCF